MMLFYIKNMLILPWIICIIEHKSMHMITLLGSAVMIPKSKLSSYLRSLQLYTFHSWVWEFGGLGISLCIISDSWRYGRRNKCIIYHNKNNRLIVEKIQYIYHAIQFWTKCYVKCKSIIFSWKIQLIMENWFKNRTYTYIK